MAGKVRTWSLDSRKARRIPGIIPLMPPPSMLSTVTIFPFPTTFAILIPKSFLILNFSPPSPSYLSQLGFLTGVNQDSSIPICMDTIKLLTSSSDIYDYNMCALIISILSANATWRHAFFDFFYGFWHQFSPLSKFLIWHVNSKNQNNVFHEQLYDYML